jgi:hypothetical protein
MPIRITIGPPGTKLDWDNWGKPVTDVINEHDDRIAAIESATVGTSSTVDTTSRTTTSTSYTATLSPAGLCGVVFVAPQSGKVTLLWTGEMFNSGANNITSMSPAVRTGAVVGSGSLVLAADDDRAIRVNVVSPGDRHSCAYLLSGLTAGTTYNASLEQRVNTGTGNFNRREIIALTS